MQGAWKGRVLRGEVTNTGVEDQFYWIVEWAWALVSEHLGQLLSSPGTKVSSYLSESSTSVRWGVTPPCRAANLEPIEASGGL